MAYVTEILDDEVGIQYQGVKDSSGRTGSYPIVGIMTGIFKRGRFDKPMTITSANIRGMLGYDLKNPYYVAVQDALNSGIPSVEVLRLKGANTSIISCDGATNSVHCILAVDEYGLENSEDLSASLQLIVDGVPHTFREVVIGLDIDPIDFSEDPIDFSEVPFLIEDGFEAIDGIKLSNGTSVPKRIEIITNTEHIKVYMWDNPTINQIDGNNRNHVGACLSAKNEITCDGATNDAWFTNGSGAFNITVNDQFYENTGNWGIGYMINQNPELAAILTHEGDGDSRFFNKSSDFLRIKLEPIDGTVWDIKGANSSNSTIGISDDGVVQFCLAPYVPPIEEPIWDIKYLVNGSWIYETTGSIVEHDANRNMYKNGATALVIADTVTTLGSGVFGNWNALTSVELGQSLRSIGSSAFAYCTNLTEFKCPNSLESLGYSALNSCTKLRLIEFGTNLISIGASACISCYVLETVVFRARIMPTLGQYAFGNGGSGEPNPSAVYVPDDLFNEYAEAIWNLADISKFRSLSTYES